MAAFIGIDLGTTYSSISYIDDNGRPQIIRNSEGQESTPSCILFEGDYLPKEEFQTLAELPSRDELLAKFAMMDSYSFRE